MFCRTHVEPFSREVVALSRDLPRCAFQRLGRASVGFLARALGGHGRGALGSQSTAQRAAR